MEIYIITKGTYSDYRICAATTSREKAERLKRLFDGGMWDEACIETFNDGEGTELNLFWDYNVRKNTAELFDSPDKETLCLQGSETISVWVYAKDKEHAKKKAQDMIAEYKASPLYQEICTYLSRYDPSAAELCFYNFDWDDVKENRIHVRLDDKPPKAEPVIRECSEAEKKIAEEEQRVANETRWRVFPREGKADYKGYNDSLSCMTEKLRDGEGEV